MEKEDDIMDFFDLSRPFERKIVSGGYCNGSVIPGKLDIQRLPERVQQGTEYSASFAKTEEARLIKAFSEKAIETAETSQLDAVDDMSSMTEDDAEQMRRIRGKELMEPLFNRYNFTVDSTRLPIHGSKSKILDAIRTNPVVILHGMTGCGKTTQVPQFLLEEAYQRKEYCNMVVTQPRKIAAMSIAKRVAEERSCELGSLVGFKVGLKEMTSPDTRLLYVTTGVLLQWLINEQSMTRFTHIILDEVHERELNMDFLLIIVRRLLATNSQNTKIILMSATINAMEFSHYFKIPRLDSLLAPQLSVATCRRYDVSEFYLDQIEQLQVNFYVNYDKPEICKEMYTIAGKLSIVCDRLIDRFEPSADSHIDYKPSIIIFLPGINEIERMAEVLKNLTAMQGPIKEQAKFTILKLHSILPPDEQALVFLKPPSGHRKVILSTNIAESSVTIPDIKFVIDFCLHRVLVADTVNNFTTLRTQWASKNNCIQRAGRAGRVMNGRVYRLVDKHFFEKGMSQSMEPEMVRCPLGNVVLQAKLLRFGQPHEILAMALTPPNLSDISNTLLQLKELGALLRTVDGIYNPQDGDMTYLGKLMSHLPLNLHLSKLVVLGYVFSVLEESIIIAAGMNVKNIFHQLRTVRSFSGKMRFADGSSSDGICILNAYTMWRSMTEQGTGGNTVEWCRRMQLDRKSLMEMAELVQEIKMRLDHSNVRVATGPNRVMWGAGEKTVILKVVMAGAFYPNYFTSINTSERDVGERRVYMEVGGRDPFSTVFFSGFDNRTYIGPLYREQIKNLISDGDQSKNRVMKVEFDDSTNKIFIRFTKSTGSYDAPGRIHQGVYDAIKQRKLRPYCELKVMHQPEAIKFAMRNNLGVWEDHQWHPRRLEIPNARLSVVPPIYCKRLRASVTHVKHPGKFFLRPLDDPYGCVYRDIDQKLNSSAYQRLNTFSAEHVFHKREIVAARLPHENNKRYGRAQLLHEQITRDAICWTVVFLDHGYHANLPTSSFHQLTGSVLGPLAQLPQRIFEAKLAEVQPAAVYSPKGVWTAEVTNHFKGLVHGRDMLVEVYSVFEQVASVVLRISNDPKEPSINQKLIDGKHAQPSEESYVSKMNHHKRTRIQSEIEFNEQYRAVIVNDMSELERFVEDDEQNLELPQELLRMRLTLNGPHSPLEMRCTSAIFSGYNKSVGVESESVNSVLLDTNPQDVHSKLLIAACVNETTGRKLIARQTTIMPNIPGLPILMTLIFAPSCMLKKSLDETRVIGVLAGLGLHPEKNVSIYPEHDVSLAAEVAITDADIADINALRYSMDTILQVGRCEDMPRLGEYSIESLMVKVKEYLIKILQRERSIVEDDSMAHNFQWISDSEAAGPSNKKPKQSFYTAEIFPLHDNLNLRSNSLSQDEFKLRHSSELHKLAVAGVPLPKDGIRCQLCDVWLETLYSLRLHLPTKLHRERQQQINFQQT